MENKSTMIRLLYQLTADFIFFIHLILVCIVAIGWLIPGLFYLHLTLLLATFLSEIFFGHCILTRIEYALRHKIDPTLVFDKSCIVHYIRKWRGLNPRVISTNKKSFLKKNSFLFILLIIGILSISYNYYL